MEFPPGYHFNPTDGELIFYLKKKTMNEPIPYNKIPEVNIYQYNPQQLSEKFLPLEENIWYFFTPRDRKFQNGVHVNRVAGTGNWKATAKDKPVRYNGEVVGSKKVLVFYECAKSKTNWIMHEYTIKEHNPKRKNTNTMRMDDWVLCRIYNRDDKSLSNQYPHVVANVPMDNTHVQFNDNNNYTEPSTPHQSVNIGQSNGKINNCEDLVLPLSEYVLNEHPLMSNFKLIKYNYLPPSDLYLEKELFQEPNDQIKTSNDDIEDADCDMSGFEEYLETLLTSNEVEEEVDLNNTATKCDLSEDFCMELETMLKSNVMEEEEVNESVDGFDDFCMGLETSNNYKLVEEEDIIALNNQLMNDADLEDFCIGFVKNL